MCKNSPIMRRWKFLITLTTNDSKIIVLTCLEKLEALNCKMLFELLCYRHVDEIIAR